MKININRLRFSLPDRPFGAKLEAMRELEQELKVIAEKAGTGNDKFKAVFGSLWNSVEQDQNLEAVLDSPIKVRALSLLLSSKMAEKVKFSQRVLEKISQLRPVPSTLFLKSVEQYYLTHYDQSGDYKAVGAWLLENLPKRNLKKPFHDYLYGIDGPKWLAQEAIKAQREFQNQVVHLGLDRYISGRFMTLAVNIYYVEQLKSIPLNEPHQLLEEVQRPSVFDAPYDERSLLGHRVLKTLISRAANTSVHDSWLQVVMAIAGDPRVPKSHPKFQKWWSQLDQGLHRVVQGWLSKLDLRLFLEALENFSNQPGQEELRRMFPSRKRFLEGLDDKKLVSHTRLYLSRSAEKYLKLNYKAKHLPEYSVVQSGDKSLIYVQLANGQAHFLEGSHSCYLWIYARLHGSAVVFNYGKSKVTYSELTAGLNTLMESHGCGAVAKITHQPVNFSWQKNALETLKKLGVRVTAQDVLSASDYRLFKRQTGII
ncbi:EH signature domain-containing protein [Endozoicomonas sp. 4G]|uniref:EH signature domain-containing protein n=1 Tax=Endozoicomonas sp. 4G TaxID=2872754 RepID=UPI00207892B0|nr:EH signature domain-containing protein [Endozoicomonas sp. 4G]